MYNLFSAISTRWTAKMNGRTLYNTEASEKAVYPYNVVSIITNVPDFGFDNEEDENFLIQFNLFSENTEETEILKTYSLLKAAFDKYDLPVTGYTLVSLVRGPANLIREEKKWQLNVSYMIQLSKNL